MNKKKLVVFKKFDRLIKRNIIFEELKIITIQI